MKPAEQPLSVGARCSHCDWTWAPELAATVRDIERATDQAREHRRLNPGHITTVSGAERTITRRGSSIRMLALEVER